MSLASLRPMLYEGRCAVKLPSLLGTLPARVMLTGYYRTGMLDVNIRPEGIGSLGMGARVELEGLESFLSSGSNGAITERVSDDGAYVVMFKAHYSRRRLLVTIRRAHMPEVHMSALLELDGLPEFCRWCSRAALIFFEGGRMVGFDAAELAELCGVADDDISARLTLANYDGGAFADLSIVDVFAEIDPAADAEIACLHRRVAGVQ